MLAWPRKNRIESALRSWVDTYTSSTPELLAVGYIGSYARGDWGVGSDLDIVVILEKSDLPFERRALRFDTTRLPVPADMIVYTQEELAALMDRGGRFAETMRREACWVWRRSA